jgi:hypothetical protein
MSDPQPVEAVKLIASIFCSRERLIGDAIEALSERYGKADFISDFSSFAYTDYYVKEFGGSLVRRFVAFEQLIRPEGLPDIKLWTNALERGTSDQGQRKVNIDPGYLARAHLILATGKGYSHRPYLRDGIYADLTLLYRDKAFHALPWTYPDYAGEEVMGMLTKIREKYVLQLKGKAAGGSAAVPVEKIINQEITQ